MKLNKTLLLILTVGILSGCVEQPPMYLTTKTCVELEPGTVSGVCKRYDTTLSNNPAYITYIAEQQFQIDAQAAADAQAEADYDAEYAEEE